MLFYFEFGFYEDFPKNSLHFFYLDTFHVLLSRFGDVLTYFFNLRWRVQDGESKMADNLKCETSLGFLWRYVWHVFSTKNVECFRHNKSFNTFAMATVRCNRVQPKGNKMWNQHLSYCSFVATMNIHALSSPK